MKFEKLPAENRQDQITRTLVAAGFLTLSFVGFIFADLPIKRLNNTSSSENTTPTTKVLTNQLPLNQTDAMLSSGKNNVSGEDIYQAEQTIDHNISSGVPVSFLNDAVVRYNGPGKLDFAVYNPFISRVNGQTLFGYMDPLVQSNQDKIVLFDYSQATMSVSMPNSINNFAKDTDQVIFPGYESTADTYDPTNPSTGQPYVSKLGRTMVIGAFVPLS